MFQLLHCANYTDLPAFNSNKFGNGGYSAITLISLHHNSCFMFCV